jgi:hypothetical protein
VVLRPTDARPSAIPAGPLAGLPRPPRLAPIGRRARADSEAMGGVLLPDPTLKAHEAFAYEFEGIEESDEWLAVMSV